MDVSVKNRDALNAVLTVKISNKDYATPYENSLKNYRKQIQMPAFESVFCNFLMNSHRV